MSASDPGSVPGGAGQDWLIGECAAVLRVPAETGAVGGKALGMRAADSGVRVQELVAAMLDAAAVVWAGRAAEAADEPARTHRQAAQLLATTRAVLAGVLDGYARQNRAELDRNDLDRAEFLNDLLTGTTSTGPSSSTTC